MASEAKIVFLGAQGVGKTSIVLRFVDGTYSDSNQPTVGAAFFERKLNVGPNRLLLQLWDTAGQERFRSMAPMYYRGAAAAVVEYDLTEPKSLQEAKDWVTELNRNVKEPIILCIAANKVDALEQGNRTMIEQGREYAESISALFFETSAKQNTGINEMFLAISKKLIAQGYASSKKGSVDLAKSGAKSEGCAC